jgi:N-acyl homoserine lactone hydrolase
MNMKIKIFNTGNIETRICEIIDMPELTQKINICIPFFLIEHPKGLVLFDGGLPLAAINNLKRYIGDEIANTFECSSQTSNALINQLTKQNINFSDIKFVIMSHLHFDHIGSLGYFPNATHIVQKKELEYANDPNSFMKDLYISKDINKIKNWFTLGGYDDNYYDIFGDGSIRVVFTPGHTPGHQSLLVNMSDDKKYFLTGDALHLSVGLEKDVLPAPQLCYNAEEYMNTVRNIRLLKESGIKIIIAHQLDKELLKNPVLQ